MRDMLRMAQVLLYRKHVITAQPYIAQLVRCLEAGGVRPVPVFINGVEAHTIVRDQLTTAHEQADLRARAGARRDAPQRDAIEVDAIVSTIGFPVRGVLWIFMSLRAHDMLWCVHTDFKRANTIADMLRQ